MATETIPKHTPGPWQARLVEVVEVPHPTDIKYKVWEIEPHIGESHSEVDARLIAAAPELLEAAKLVLETLLEPESFKLSEVADRHGLLQAAISKAEGR